MIRSIRSAAAGLVLLSALAACSANAGGPSGVATLESAAPGAQSSAQPSAQPSASLSPEDAALAFTECMREQGLDMPDANIKTGPGGGVAFSAGGPDADPKEGALDPDQRGKFQDAMEACRGFLKKAGNIRSDLDPEMQDRMLAFAACMRKEGIPMSDPAADGGITIQGSDDGTGTNGDDRIDPSSTEFQQAQEACQPILGDALTGSGPKTQSSSGDESGGSLQVVPDSGKP